MSEMSQNYLNLKTVFVLQTFQQLKSLSNSKLSKVSIRELVQISECY